MIYIRGDIKSYDEYDCVKTMIDAIDNLFYKNSDTDYIVDLESAYGNHYNDKLKRSYANYLISQVINILNHDGYPKSNIVTMKLGNELKYALNRKKKQLKIKSRKYELKNPELVI